MPKEPDVPHNPGNGPRPLTPNEAVELLNSFRSQMRKNGLKINWREAKVLMIILCIVSGFLSIFLIWMTIEEPFLGPFIGFFLVMVVLAIGETKYTYTTRISFFLRTDINFLFPSLVNRKAIVFHNIKQYITIQALAVVAFAALMTYIHSLLYYSVPEVYFLLINLLILKLIFFALNNLIESLKRQRWHGRVIKYLSPSVKLFTIITITSFDLFPLIFLFLQEFYPSANILSSPVGTLVILLCLPVFYLLKKNFVPFIGKDWYEDSKSLAFRRASVATAQHTSVIGEEVREISRENDLERKFNLVKEERFRMKETGTGFKAVREKCNVVFLRSQLSWLATISVPITIMGLLTCLFLDLIGVIVLIMLSMVLILAFVGMLATNNPVHQNTIGFENIYLLPIPATRIIGDTVLRIFTALLIGVLPFIVLILSFGGVSILVEIFIPLTKLVIFVFAFSVFLTTVSIHLNRNFYPHQMERTYQASIGLIFMYAFTGLFYLIMTMFELFGGPIIPFLFEIVTLAIIIIGPKASLHFYRTISIH